MSGLELPGFLAALGGGAGAAGAGTAAAGTAAAGAGTGLAAGAGTGLAAGTAGAGTAAMSTPGIFAAAPVATELTPEMAAGIANGSIPMSTLSTPAAAGGATGAPAVVPPIQGNSPLGTAAKNTVDVLNATGALRRPSGGGPQVHMSPVMTGRQAALVSRPAVSSPVQRYLALLRR